MKTFLVIILAGATAALTIVVRVPIPGTGGYLNFGDIAVVFCGLFLGKKMGPLAGGLGSALADIIGGFFIYAPITLVAKGLEGFIAGLISEKRFTRIPVHTVFPGSGEKKSKEDVRIDLITVALLLSAGFTMVAVYFVAELFLPGVGFGAAVSEVPFNIIQAVSGAVGGYFVFIAVIKALPSERA
jgi:uncharacterized membrane protein